jgi:hypothetical protein
MPRTSKKLRQPSYCSSTSEDSSIILGFSNVIDWPSGVRMIAAKRPMLTCGAAKPIPLVNLCTCPTRSNVELSCAITRRASSASTGKSNGRATSASTASPSCAIPRERIRSDGLIVSIVAASSSPPEPLNFHSTRYRVCIGGSSVDQLNTTRSPWHSRRSGERNGDASAVIEVSKPHTAGFRHSGKSRTKLSRRVGRRIARCHHGPHLLAPTVYRYSIHAVSPGYSGNLPSAFSNSSQSSLKASRSCFTRQVIGSSPRRAERPISSHVSGSSRYNLFDRSGSPGYRSTAIRIRYCATGSVPTLCS